MAPPSRSAAEQRIQRCAGALVLANACGATAAAMGGELQGAGHLDGQFCLLTLGDELDKPWFFTDGYTWLMIFDCRKLMKGDLMNG